MTQTHCDFCGTAFNAEKPFSRTCYACSSQGAPDQATMRWSDYLRRSRLWQADRDPAKAEKLRRGYALSGHANVPLMAAMPSRPRRKYFRTPKRNGTVNATSSTESDGGVK